MPKSLLRPISEILLRKKNAAQISQRFFLKRNLIVLGHSHFILPILKILGPNILLHKGATLPMHNLEEVNNTRIHLLNAIQYHHYRYIIARRPRFRHHHYVLLYPS